MSISRRCPKCQIFTENSDYCSSCNELINFELIKKRDQAERKKVDSEKAPDKIDVLFQKLKNSKYLLVRMVYQLVYSIWFVFAAILSFFMFMIAAMPG